MYGSAGGTTIGILDLVVTSVGGGSKGTRVAPSRPSGEKTMPVHDWTKVDAGIFHHFHLEWMAVLARALNSGLLPPDHYAWEAVPAFWREVLQNGHAQ